MFKSKLALSIFLTATLSFFAINHSESSAIRFTACSIDEDDPCFDRSCVGGKVELRSSPSSLLKETYVNRGQVLLYFDPPETTCEAFSDIDHTAEINSIPVKRLTDGKYYAIEKAKQQDFVLSTTGGYKPWNRPEAEFQVNIIEKFGSDTRGAGIPKLRRIKIKNDLDQNQMVLVAQKSFPSYTDVILVYDDGSFVDIDVRDISYRKRKKRLVFTNPEPSKNFSLYSADFY